jgi:endonuclease/exonuclease/phosphatase family metal-dependent hydrolase
MHRLFVLLLLISTSASASAPHTIRAMTLNTRHGGRAPWSIADQISEIVKEHPDIVFLQEARAGQLEKYVDGINAGLKTSSWHGAVSRHCVAGTALICSSPSAEGVMILSHFHFADVEPRVIWAADEFVAGRAALRVKLLLDDATPLQAFSVHLPALRNAKRARVKWMTTFKGWASMFPGPQIVGGDFNEGPSDAAVASMSADYTNAWSVKGRGDGATHARDDVTFDSRIDYLFSSGGLKVESAFVPQVTISDHRPVVADYVVPPRPAVSSPSPDRSGSDADVDSVVRSKNFRAAAAWRISEP